MAWRGWGVLLVVLPFTVPHQTRQVENAARLCSKSRSSHQFSFFSVELAPMDLANPLGPLSSL